jgi:hypothetical protein
VTQKLEVDEEKKKSLLPKSEKIKKEERGKLKDEENQKKSLSS